MRVNSAWARPARIIERNAGQLFAMNFTSGFGFSDTSQAAENVLIRNGRIHKLAQVDCQSSLQDFKWPGKMSSPDGRLDLEFTLCIERLPKTNLWLITSEVHQMFGRYTCTADDGEAIHFDSLVGWAEVHHARWSRSPKPAFQNRLW